MHMDALPPDPSSYFCNGEKGLSHLFLAPITDQEPHDTASLAQKIMRNDSNNKYNIHTPQPGSLQVVGFRF